MSLTATDVAGTYRAVSCSCVTLDISPSCGEGICLIQKVYGCPCLCCFACKCGENCWYFGSNAGLQWKNANELTDGCGEFRRETTGAPEAEGITRE